MDVVSDAISAVRLGRPLSNRVRMSGSWCVRLDPYVGAGFAVVMKGGCRLLPDGGAPVSLGVGDVVLLPHGAGHVIADSRVDPAAALEKAVPFTRRLAETGPRVVPDPDETDVLCGKYRLDCSRLHPLMAELPQVVHLPHRVGRHPELRAAIDLLAGELDESRPGSSIAHPSLLDLLLVYIIRSWMAEATSGAWPRALGDPVTAAALRALHADPAAPWSNDRLAAEAGVSRPTLARRFSTLVGRPPMAYLTWWRLILAAILLRDTPDTLAAIAGRVGYGSPYALSHAFEREFGTTPGRYRAKGTFEPGPLPRVGLELGDLRRAGRAGDPEGDLAQ
ncbi:AraC family transcriptional regulator [Nonomuraea deserti]|uniref:AraC family transcriptional regulator n=1 Tax=Nonomuraea deserti TaxID=1848322 RepID=A0A4R4VE23_9ACTN|nr:AraC family transcriptional regulator [Nonomuraea deserti]TDD00215.1 AraC family transcriptional regulator [Nonomuraea deserti]